MSSSRKKIMVVGGTGTIGHAVIKELSQRHDVICVAHSHGDYTVDITSSSSIQQLYQKVGKLDAVVSTTGKVKFAPLNQMDSSGYQIGLDNKLMGQVNLVLLGIDFIMDGGSFTLTSGILSHDPIAAGTSAAMVNGAVDSFVKAAAIELPRGIRINSISPTVIEESLSLYQDFFRGYKPVPVCDVALAYSKSVEGLQTGQTYYVH